MKHNTIKRELWLIWRDLNNKQLETFCFSGAKLILFKEKNKMELLFFILYNGCFTNKKCFFYKKLFFLVKNKKNLLIIKLLNQWYKKEKLDLNPTF